MQYADYAAWQRRLFEAEQPSALCQREEAYWLKALAGAPTVVPLSTDHPRPGELSTRGGRVPVRIDAELHRDVRTTAQRSGCTVFMLVHAALALVLRARGGGDDVVIAISRSN